MSAIKVSVIIGATHVHLGAHKLEIKTLLLFFICVWLFVDIEEDCDYISKSQG